MWVEVQLRIGWSQEEHDVSQHDESHICSQQTTHSLWDHTETVYKTAAAGNIVFTVH